MYEVNLHVALLGKKRENKWTREEGDGLWISGNAHLGKESLR